MTEKTIVKIICIIFLSIFLFATLQAVISGTQYRKDLYERLLSDIHTNNWIEAKSKIDNLEAFKKLEELIKYQGGDISYLEDYSKFEKSKYQKEIYSSKEGYVEKISALEIGECAMHLGAGRATKDDVIDMASGIVLNKKVGDFVKKGELLLTCYTNKENVEEIYKDLENSYIIVQNKVPNHKIIHEIIG